MNDGVPDCFEKDRIKAGKKVRRDGCGEGDGGGETEREDYLLDGQSEEMRRQACNILMYV